MVRIVVLNMSWLDCPLRILIVDHVVRFLPSFQISFCGSMQKSCEYSVLVLVWSIEYTLSMGMPHLGRLVRRYVVVRGCCTINVVDRHRSCVHVCLVPLGLLVVTKLPVQCPCRNFVLRMYCIRILSCRQGHLYSIGETNVQIAYCRCGPGRSRVVA